MEQKKWEKIIFDKLKKPLSKKEIARILKTKSNSKKFEEFLATLILKGKIIQLKNNKYGLVKEMSMLTGIIDVNPKGFGFIIPDNGGEDIYVAMHNMGTALDKDRVVFKIIRESANKKREARVIRVIERRTKRITGIFIEGKHYNYVICDDKKFNKNIIITDSKVKVKTAEHVVVKLNEWSSNRDNPEGEIVEVIKIGNKMDLLNKKILIDNGFDEQFPRDIENYAKNISFDIKKEIKNRIDLRKDFTITIDPPDAKDFDDAVSIKKIEDNYRVGVHIADVSYFVKENSIIDKEAYKRATSVYLTGKTVPMLPEKLSNDICSLKPGEERLTLTCEFTIRANGEPIDYKIYPSIIINKKRLSYKDAQLLIDSKNNDILTNDLKLMNCAAKKLRKYYNKRGRIDFDRSENEIILNDNKEPIEIRIKEQYDTHKLIEDFMITANMFVAKFLNSKYIDFIYRIHEKPSKEKIENLNILLSRYGYKLKTFNPHKIQKILNQVKNTAYEFLIKESILRTMKRAVYSTDNNGHFGLALDYYTHFTSPIRRYPDLIVHRILRKLFSKNKTLSQDYELIAKHCSEREWASEKSERESSMIAKLIYLKNINKKVFKGIVSSLTPFGIFILIDKVFVEGLLRFRDMEDDFYELNENEFFIRGVNNGKRIQLGDILLVEIKEIIPERGQLNLSIKKKL